MALPRASLHANNIKALAEALSTLLAIASHSAIPDMSTPKGDSGDDEPEK